MAEPAVAMGGLSVTGCLADFSVNMFHPYGGKKSSLKEAQWSPLSDTERKDSLSINVEFVKFHLSRSRKLDFQTDQDQSKATVRFSSEFFEISLLKGALYVSVKAVFANFSQYPLYNYIAL